MVKSRSLSKVAAMTLREQIETAFVRRPRPSKLVELREPVTPEQRDALWFAGRHWRDVGWQAWQIHPDAFYAFVPEAFTFYLPSVLIAALDAPKGQLQAADALLGMLARAPEVCHWDAFITQRLLGLEAAEYEATKAWVLARSGMPGPLDEDSLTRAYETVDLLAHETARIRNLLRTSSTQGDTDENA